MVRILSAARLPRIAAQVVLVVVVALSPVPATALSAESNTIEITPQTMPNIVRKLRSLCAIRFVQVCDRSSCIGRRFRDRFDSFRRARFT